MPIHQMDVVLAFLNGTVEEEIYMQQPEGYVMEPGKEELAVSPQKIAFWSKTKPTLLEQRLQGIHHVIIGICSSCRRPMCLYSYPQRKAGDRHCACR